MKLLKLTILALSAALPLAAGALTLDAPSAASPQLPVATSDVSARLSPPAREILKMAASGVPDDVIRAYIDSSSSTFNLTSDGIISLQGVGVSTGVTSAMLAHDKAIVDRATAYNPPPPMPANEPPPQAGPAPEANSVQVSTIPYDPSYYSGLSPYGGWYNDATYGSYFAPYPWVDWSLYPWGFGVFGGGRWWHHPVRGWCWSPGVRFGGGFGFRGGFRDGFRGGFGFGGPFGFRGGGGFGHGGGFSHGGFHGGGHVGGGFGGRGGRR